MLQLLPRLRKGRGNGLPARPSLRWLTSRPLARLATKASSAETEVVISTPGTVPPSSLLRGPSLRSGSDWRLVRLRTSWSAPAQRH
eukprot:5046124-Amphidinium_carterae.1